MRKASHILETYDIEPITFRVEIEGGFEHHSYVTFYVGTKIYFAHIRDTGFTNWKKYEIELYKSARTPLPDDSNDRMKCQAQTINEALREMGSRLVTRQKLA